MGNHRDSEGPQVHVINSPEDLFSALRSAFGPMLPPVETGPVSLDRSDLEAIADALIFYHGAMDAMSRQGFVSEIDEAHEQHHETGAKVANILRRMIEQDPTLTVNVTPF